METLTEQRTEKRSTITWPVSIWLPEATRFYNGKSCNVSKTGVFVKMPMTAPLRPGQIVEINFPRTTELAEEKGQYARIKRGKVIRVDRESVLEDAQIGVGIAFE